jgi:hypothetical protein
MYLHFAEILSGFAETRGHFPKISVHFAYNLTQSRRILLFFIGFAQKLKDWSAGRPACIERECAIIRLIKLLYIAYQRRLQAGRPALQSFLALQSFYIFCAKLFLSEDIRAFNHFFSARCVL